MANSATTFRDLFATLQNPFVPPDAQYTSFRANAGLQPAGILASLESSQYPSVLLAAKIDGTPALYLAPFGAATLPGVALPTTKFAFLGDFSQAGNPPALATITANFFHLSGNATVLAVGDVAAAWVGVAVGAQLLQPPVAGANTEQVQTQNSMPVPHAYTNAVLRAYANGTLTWEWFWTNVAASIIVDPTQAADLEPFTIYRSTRMPDRRC
jgi:hypothetical protein